MTNKPTTTKGVPTEITLEGMEKAVGCLKELKLDRQLVAIEMCKKHWKQLQNDLDFVEVKHKFGIPSLYGIKVIVKPYIKKARLYYKKL